VAAGKASLHQIFTTSPSSCWPPPRSGTPATGRAHPPCSSLSKVQITSDMGGDGSHSRWMTAAAADLYLLLLFSLPTPLADPVTHLAPRPTCTLLLPSSISHSPTFLVNVSQIIG
jgi:hypothetical protein